MLLVLLMPWTAQAAKPTIQVLTLESQEGLEKYASKFAKPFLQAAKAELNKYFKVSTHDIVEMELNVCEQPNNKTCFRTLYAKGGHDALLLGKVLGKKGNSSSVTVVLYYFSRTYRSKPRNVTFVVPRKITSSKVKTIFRQKIRNLIKGEKGRLEIVIPVSGVKIEIDGTVIAASAQKGTIPATLPPGAHKVVVTKGDKRIVKTAEVSIFTSTTVRISKEELIPAPVPAKTPTPAVKTKPEPKQAAPAPAAQSSQQTASAPAETETPSEPKPAEEPTWWQRQNKWKVAFWSSAALTVVLFGSAIYTGMKVRNLENEKEDFMRDSPHSSDYVGVDDVCSMEIPAGDEHLKEICDDGKQMALTTNILMFTGVLTGLATGYFMHKAYIDTDDGVKTDSEISPEGGSSMSIAPYFGPHSGGISFTLSY